MAQAINRVRPSRNAQQNRQSAVYAATRPLFDRLLRRLPLPPEAWRIEILPCWQPMQCYWKTLPQGFHAQAEIGIGQFDGLPLWDELPQWKKSLCRTALKQPEN